MPCVIMETAFWYLALIGVSTPCCSRTLAELVQLASSLWHLRGLMPISLLSTYTNHASYLVPSLQAAYDFSPVKPRIKAVLLTNPSNPLGKCYPRHVLIECLEFCQERGLHLVSDELYALTDLGGLEKGEEVISVLSMTDPFLPQGAIKVDPNRVHLVWSASKLFGVSGLRVVCLQSKVNECGLTLPGLPHLAAQSQAHRSCDPNDSSARQYPVHTVSFVAALIVAYANSACAQFREVKSILPNPCGLSS